MTAAACCATPRWRSSAPGSCTCRGCPTLLYEIAHTAAPWDSAPRFGAPVQISRDLLGGDRITMVLVLATVIGLGSLFTRAHRRTREWTTLLTLIVLPVATLGWPGCRPR